MVVLHRKPRLSPSSSQSLLLQIGEAMLEEEAREVEKEKMNHMEENCPPLSIPGCMQDLQVNLHQQLTRSAHQHG